MGGDVEVRHLRVLVALAEEGTFTDAAIRLGTSQPAVSRTLAGLETLLGVELVHRTTRRLELTDAGRACHRAAVSALLAVDAVRDAAAGRTRPLRLGYAWAALGRHTGAILRTWRAERPDVPLVVHRVEERDAGLARGLVDVAVRRTDVTTTPAWGDGDEPALAGERVFEEGRLAVLPVGSPLADRDRLTLADLSDQTIVVTPPVGTTSAALWPPEIRPTTFLEQANTDEWLLAIASGLAVGVTPESTPTQHTHPGVVFVPLDGVAPIRVSLTWFRDRRHPALDDFLAVVRRCVEAA